MSVKKIICRKIKFEDELTFPIGTLPENYASYKKLKAEGDITFTEETSRTEAGFLKQQKVSMVVENPSDYAFDASIPKILKLTDQKGNVYYVGSKTRKCRANSYKEDMGFLTVTFQCNLAV